MHAAHSTPCPRKNYNTHRLPKLWQTTPHFNEILHQHCAVQLQTSHQILAKSVNMCNSYSKFSKVTQSISVHYRHTRDWLSKVCVRANGKTSAHLKSVFKMSTVCSSRTQAARRGCHCLTALSMTTWWKCTHSSIRRDFSWSTSRGCGTHDPAASTKYGSWLG